MSASRQFIKATAITALTLSGVATVSAVKPSLHAFVQAATMRVRINYVPGYGINIWNNFHNKRFTGVRAKHGTTWNVLATQTDRRGRTWYEIGAGQWIMAKYTVSATTPVAKPKSHARKVRVQRVTNSATARNNVVRIAEQQVGRRYVWGGRSTSGFDCSGLTQYVYQYAAGINITGTTYTQVKKGYTVNVKNVDDLQAGDLLFWGNPASPYHVAVYIGNGRYVAAATPSQGVVESRLTSYFYPSLAKRVL
ncbi:MAG: C40 family peptidase [Lactobacillus sp.]|nr:C40 family peptidase [Lactobacillus sp.]MDN6042955.1 C40 family peptidase [Lactobacillus sp.]MDN6052745.1 C40 family peptidase [Lactobacillus sp.]